MSQEFENQANGANQTSEVNQTSGTYQAYEANQNAGGVYVDPLDNMENQPEQKPEKKQSTVMSIISIVVSVVVFKLFGLLGGVICFGGFAVVMAIMKSKMSTTAKVILSVVTIVGFVLLLFAFILFSAAVLSSY